MSNEEVLNYLSKTKGLVCGRSEKSQLHHVPDLSNKLKSFLYALAIIFLPLIPTNVFGQEIDNSITYEADKKITYLRGIVADQKEEGVPFASVGVFQNGILKGFAKSNIKGTFLIKPLLPGNYTIRVSAVNFRKSEKKITINSNLSKSCEIILEPRPKSEYTIGSVKFINHPPKKEFKEIPIKNLNKISGQEIRDMFGG